jgi:amino acid adenylation domain-containing protein
MIRNNLIEPFLKHCREAPERTALFVEGRDVSYGELEHHSLKVAAWLLDNCPEPDARIGLFTSRHLDTYAGLLGTAWAGKTYVPLNPLHPVPHLEKLAGQSLLSVIIVDDSTVQQVDSIRRMAAHHKVLLPSTRTDNKLPAWISTTSDTEWFEPVKTSPDHLVYLLFTSGTTGDPKMVGANLLNVDHFLKVSADRYTPVPEDRFSNSNELDWDPSLFDLFVAWDSGASLHIVPQGARMLPVKFIQEQELTVWYSAPSVIHLCDKMGLLKEGSLPSVRLSLFVGEPLSKRSAAAWSRATVNGVVENVYGPTETTVVVSYLSYDPDIPAQVTEGRGYLSIGTPYEGCHLAIVDNELNFLPSGSNGEILIGGPQVTPGYWNDQVLTAEKFIELNHPQLGKTLWYRTGDEGYEDDHRLFHILGRLDSQVQVLGTRVELEAVEAHLKEVTGCDEVAVFGWPVVDGICEGLAAVIGKPEGSVAQLKRDMAQRVPMSMVPGRILFTDQLERKPNGKLDRKAILSHIEGK